MEVLVDLCEEVVLEDLTEISEMYDEILEEIFNKICEEICNEVSSDQCNEAVGKMCTDNQQKVSILKEDDVHFSLSQEDEVLTDVDETEHWNTCVEENRFSCDKCDYTSTKNKNMEVHMNFDHKDIHYSCEVCNYVAILKSDLIHHTEYVH